MILAAETPRGSSLLPKNLANDWRMALGMSLKGEATSPDADARSRRDGAYSPRESADVVERSG